MPVLDPSLVARRLGAALALVASLAACDRSATDPEVEPGLVIAEMVLVDGDGNVMYSHADHWHGFPVVPAGGELPVQQYFVARGSSADDHEVPPRDEWFTLEDRPADVRTDVVVTDTLLARWSGDRVRGTLAGRGRTGASSASWVVYRGTTTLRQLPPLPFSVR